MPARALGRKAGGGLESIYALYLEADVHRGRGEFAEAIEVGEQMLAQAEASGDRQAALLANAVQGVTEFFAGRLAPARTHLERALSLYRDGEDDALEALVGLKPQAVILTWLPLVLWMLGFIDQAARCANRALDLARKTNQPYTLAVTLAAMVILGIYGLPGRDLPSEIDALQRLVDEYGVEAFRPWARVYRGWLMARQGQVTEGVAEMRRNLPSRGMGGTNLSAPMFRALLAQVCLEAGLYDEGMVAVNEGWDLRRRGVGLMAEAELYRLQGALILGRDGDAGLEAAEALFLKAAAVAHEQQALIWELRAVIDLARLWRRTGRTQGAYTRLAEVYARFSEGFDLPDMQAAAALLEEWASARQQA